MKLLLDTHIFLWLINDNQRLSDKFRQAIQDPKIKYQIGKLDFPCFPEIYLPIQRREHLIKTLTVDESSITRLIALPLLHRDPFDRLIMSQALQYDLTLSVGGMGVSKEISK